MHSGKNEPSSPSYPVPAWIWERPSTKPECSWACSIFNHIKSCSELMVSNLLWVWYDSLSKALELGHFLCGAGFSHLKNAELMFPDTSTLFHFCWENCTVRVISMLFSIFVLSRWAQWDGLSHAEEGKDRIWREELFKSRILHLSVMLKHEDFINFIRYSIANSVMSVVLHDVIWHCYIV